MLQLKYQASQLIQLAKIKYNDWRKPEVVRIKGIKIPVLDNLPRDLQEAFYSGCYEKFELKIVKFQLQQNDIVMELGTGIGLLSSFCARKIGNERVFTYEANPALEPVIRDTYNLNNVSPNLEMCMLGDQAGEQTFYIAKGFWESSIIKHHPDFRPVKISVKAFNEEVQRINPSS